MLGRSQVDSMIKQLKISKDNCFVCKHMLSTATEKLICSYCYQALPWLINQCYLCGLPLTEEKEAIYCLACLETPPLFDRLCALFEYKSAAKYFIKKLKYQQQLSFTSIITEILNKVILQWYANRQLPQAVIPVPLSDKRLKTRGFNQTAVILNKLDKQLGISVLDNVCSRKDTIATQAVLSANARRRNLENIFSVSNIKYHHIAIFDDVVTTGSTVNSLTESFHQIGVSEVDVWCVCRA